MLEKKLNALLANYEVMYHKLQTMHWYVCGPTFFADHAQLEAYYEQAYVAIDAIAETILMIGGKPLGAMEGWLKTAQIAEANEAPITGLEAYAAIRDDYRVLLKGATEVREVAEKEDCPLVSAFADDLIAELSKNIWMLSSALA